MTDPLLHLLFTLQSVTVTPALSPHHSTPRSEIAFVGATLDLHVARSSGPSSTRTADTVDHSVSETSSFGAFLSLFVGLHLVKVSA